MPNVLIDKHRTPCLSVSEVAVACGVSAPTVRREIERGALHASRVGTQYRIAPVELERYLGGAA
jgi:excisionase family DNA binding protein